MKITKLYLYDICFSKIKDYNFYIFPSKIEIDYMHLTTAGKLEPDRIITEGKLKFRRRY